MTKQKGNLMENKYVICVDTKDNQTKILSKKKAHEKPILHRAFSVFVAKDNKMLLQKRAKQKYHCGGLWTNACCSHPDSDEIELCAKARAMQELGIDLLKLEPLFEFVYFAKFENGLFEYEYDHVFLAEYDPTQKILFDPNEVEKVQWVDFDVLSKAMAKYPTAFTPWFLHACPRVIKILENKQYQKHNHN